jgi:FKBP-type peptidyl-prolyl cis-trans isomerase
MEWLRYIFGMAFLIANPLALAQDVQSDMAQKNLEKGQQFLAINREKKDIKVTPSGLQYRIIREGTGRSPKATDTVVTNYRGTLIDGREFDSSYKRGEPATFPLNHVIPAWTEGLQLIKEGGKIELFAPPNLAYGEQGAPPVIGPNETLIFDVELISIK